jgi:hypothetical protein
METERNITDVSHATTELNRRTIQARGTPERVRARLICERLARRLVRPVTVLPLQRVEVAVPCAMAKSSSQHAPVFKIERTVTPAAAVSLR